MKGLFDKAFYRKVFGKYDNFRIVVQGLSKLPQEGGDLGEICDCIRERTPKYPKNNLKKCLEDLQKDIRGELVRYDPTSGKYSFSNPFYRAFALVYFGKDKAERKDFVIKSGGNVKFPLNENDVVSILNNLMAAVRSRPKPF